MAEQNTGKHEGGYDGSLMQIADNIKEVRDGFEFLTFAVFILGETFPLGYESTDVPLGGIHRISNLLLKDMDKELGKLREQDER